MDKNTGKYDNPLENYHIFGINDWAKRISKHISTTDNHEDQIKLRELSNSLLESREVGFQNLEKLDLPRQKRVIGDLSLFLQNPHQTFTKLNAKKYFIILIPKKDDSLVTKYSTCNIDRHTTHEFIHDSINQELIKNKYSNYLVSAKNSVADQIKVENFELNDFSKKFDVVARAHLLRYFQKSADSSHIIQNYVIKNYIKENRKTINYSDIEQLKFLHKVVKQHVQPLYPNLSEDFLHTCHEYDISVNEFLRGQYGGSISISQDNGVYIEFRPGEVTHIDKGQTPTHFVSKPPLSRTFKYSFDDITLRQLIFNSLLKVPHQQDGSDIVFYPGYYEFTIIEGNKMIFLDQRDNNVFDMKMNKDFNVVASHH
ncbi:MAG: hypothetical protein WC570_05300 [Patescibacteria group bacterium]